MLSKSLTDWVNKVAKATQPTKADMLMVGNYFKAQSLDRTSRGLDADGKPFAPYSEKRPYYWNPYSGDKKQAGTWTKQNQSVNRMIKKLGGSSKTGIIRGSTGKAVAQRSGTGTSIKFASYAAFKRTLGRAGVDLMGPRAPHMMQALTVRVADGGKGVVLGVYGEAAGRAKGHQYGVPGKLPQRKFIGATEEDRAAVMKMLSANIRGRFRAATPQAPQSSRFPTLPLPGL